VKLIRTIPKPALSLRRVDYTAGEEDLAHRKGDVLGAVNDVVRN
jgi:hypothetical protein